MSRTDKDAPYWVRSEYYEAVHWGCQYEQGTPWRSVTVTHECDLPEVPQRGHWRWTVERYQREPHCSWESEWPWRRRYRHSWGPRPRDRHLHWYGPDRAKARDWTIEARKQFHGDLDIDTDNAPIRNHRHCSIKGWWD